MDYTSSEAVTRLQRALSDLEQKIAEGAVGASEATEVAIAEGSVEENTVSYALKEAFEKLQKDHEDLQQKQAQSRLKVERLIQKVEEAL